MKSYEFTAKSVEKAIKLGLETLGKNQEDVDIQIISEGGLFKKAKVVIKVEEEQIKTFVKKEEKVEPVVETKVEEQPKHEEPKQEEQVEEPVVEETEETQTVEMIKDTNDVKPDVEEVELPQEEQIKEIENKEVVEEEQTKEPVQQKEEKHEKKGKFDYVVPTQEELEEKRRKFAETHFENNQTSVEFVEGLLKVLKIDAQVTLEEKKDNSYILVETENPGKIIGYKGDSLAGIQYIANVIEANQNPNAKRVVIDTGNYKQKREESLRALAIKVAGRVGETGRTQKLEPMSAYERRIVHTELQNYPSVETHSEGVEPYRYIVVTKKRNRD